jgi:hypothetical protein
MSITIYVANWMIVDWLYARQRWQPSSNLHDLLAGIQGIVGLVAVLVAVTGVRKDRSGIYEIVAIVLGLLCVASAAV